MTDQKVESAGFLVGTPQMRDLLNNAHRSEIAYRRKRLTELRKIAEATRAELAALEMSVT